MRSAVMAGGAAASVVFGCALTACGSQGGEPAKLADSITHGIYSDDLDATTANFDDQLKGQVTRSDLGDLSDQMHALGDYQSLAQRTADPNARKYQFDATFAKGMILVQLRLDADGKVAAYRVEPEAFPRISQASRPGS